MEAGDDAQMLMPQHGYRAPSMLGDGAPYTRQRW